MDRDSLAHRDVADDLVARDRRTAFGEPDEDVLDPLDPDPEIISGDCYPSLGRLERNGLFLGDLLRLKLVEDFVDDLADRHLARAERHVEVLGLLEAGLPDHLREDGGADELLVGKALFLQALLERLTALPLGLLAGLAG